MPIHIRNKAKEFVAVLRKKGFNTIRFFATVSGVDGVEDDESHEWKAQHNENYVLIILEPHFRFQNDSPYDSFDEAAFWKDFYAYVKTVFGEDVTIEHNDHTGEMEIMRKELLVPVVYADEA